MKRVLVICAAACLAVAVAGTAQAGTYAASASEQNEVTISGSWSNVHDYKSDVCYSGIGNPYLSDTDSRAQGSTPIDLSTSISDAYSSASSSITVDVPSGMPTINIDSDAEVHDVAPGSEHWAMGYSNGGANALRSDIGQTVDFTVDYSYILDLTQAASLDAEAEVKIYVALWDAGHQLKLTPDDDWVFVEAGDSDHLVKTVTLTSVGSSVNSGPLSKAWEVSVGAGAYYSFWSQGEAYAYTEAAIPEPATMFLAGLGLLGLLAVRRKS